MREKIEKFLEESGNVVYNHLEGYRILDIEEFKTEILSLLSDQTEELQKKIIIRDGAINKFGEDIASLRKEIADKDKEIEALKENLKKDYIEK